MAMVGSFVAPWGEIIEYDETGKHFSTGQMQGTDLNGNNFVVPMQNQAAPTPTTNPTPTPTQSTGLTGGQTVTEQQIKDAGYQMPTQRGYYDLNDTWQSIAASNVTPQQNPDGSWSTVQYTEVAPGQFKTQDAGIKASSAQEAMAQHQQLANKSSGFIDDLLTTAAPFVPMFVAGAGIGGLLDPYTVGGAVEAGAGTGMYDLGALNSFDTGAMASAMGYTPGMTMPFTAAMMESAIPTATAAGTAAATTAATTAAKAVIPGTSIPLSAIPLVAGAAKTLTTKKPGEEDGTYNPTPINQNVVNQYGNMPKVTPPNYQGFDSFSMPDGLLGNRLQQIRNNGQRGLL